MISMVMLLSLHSRAYSCVRTVSPEGVDITTTSTAAPFNNKPYPGCPSIFELYRPGRPLPPNGFMSDTIGEVCRLTVTCPVGSSAFAILDSGLVPIGDGDNFYAVKSNLQQEEGADEEQIQIEIEKLIEVSFPDISFTTTTRITRRTTTTTRQGGRTTTNRPGGGGRTTPESNGDGSSTTMEPFTEGGGNGGEGSSTSNEMGENSTFFSSWDGTVPGNSPSNTMLLSFNGEESEESCSFYLRDGRMINGVTCM